MERWLHVIHHHRELEHFQSQVLLTVSDPERLYISPTGVKPNYAAVKAFNELAKAGLAGNLAVHYREVSPSDGFILTAMVMSDERLERRFKLWQRLR